MIRAKKAQTEVLGMAFIVILITVGILLFYTFSKPTEKFHQGFADSQTATNLLIAMAKTTVPQCRNDDIGDLIANCAMNNGRWQNVNKGDMVKCGGIPTCAKANETIALILEDILKKEYDYDFRVYTFGEDVNDASQWILRQTTSASCSTRNIPGTKPGNYPLKVGATNVVLRLKVCPI